jgi:hypothetical protein
MSFELFTGGLSNIAANVTVRVADLFNDTINPVKSEQTAQTGGNNARDRIYAENKSRATGFNGEYANTVVPPVIEPAGESGGSAARAGRDGGSRRAGTPPG